MMNKVVVLFILVLATACASGKMISMHSYQEMPIGQKVADLEMKCGKPYEVRVLGNGIEEHIYLERIPISSTNEAVREYVFVISHDKIINKKMSESRSNNLQFIH